MQWNAISFKDSDGLSTLYENEEKFSRAPFTNLETYVNHRSCLSYIFSCHRWFFIPHLFFSKKIGFYDFQGDTFQTGRVSNGNLAEYGEFPYLASIAENDAHYCGGFIYNDRFIVTSASCVDGCVKVGFTTNNF